MKRIYIMLVLVMLLSLTGCSFNKLTITFNSNGGSVIESQKVKDGEVVTKPIDPTKKGFNFIEWQLNGKKYDFNTKVNTSITLDAVWKSDGTKVSYKVTYDIDGDSSSKLIDVGECAPEPNSIPSKSGYSFIGWYLKDTDSKYDFDTILTNDIVLEAKFSDTDDISEDSSISKTIIYVTDIDASLDIPSINVGESTQVNVTFSPNNATYKEVTYSSSNSKIASVSSTGIVKAIKAGDAIITIKTTDGSLLTKTVTITVLDVTQ